MKMITLFSFLRVPVDRRMPSIRSIMSFACFFSAFIQIDLNHNLMTCYPVGFMYGIAMMAVGIWLYDSWFAHLKDGKKTNVIRIILSSFCYYESMQTYEPFIMACFIYILSSVA